MNRQQSIIAAHGLTDEHDRLVKADELLAELQEACGGRLPGALAVPELRELVRQCRERGLRIAREFSAFDGQDKVGGFVRVHPVLETGEDDTDVIGGCEIIIENWLSGAQGDAQTRTSVDWLDAADRASAEITAQLDARQKLQFITSFSSDAEALCEAVEAAPGKLWSEYVELDGIAHEQPLHWRLLDGAKVTVPGSDRSWRARVLPVGPSASAPRGFELLFIANEPLKGDAHREEALENGELQHSRLVGSALTPVLRQPIARIVANAETIHARLAGPLRDEYSEYAANIAAAGQHLAGMLDDLADLEVVEAPGFKAAKERVDLADVAQRAAGILGVRAQARGISVKVDKLAEPIYAQAEFRRVLQVLINLIGNAIAYSPEESQVSVNVDEGSLGMVSVTVTDQGPGITKAQAGKIFNKFERLGRDSDGGNDTGSGLGLFISRKLALAMEGNLEVLPQQQNTDMPGAQFKLSLPVMPAE
ncbi:histidine kinase [Erythrobacter longus]|uniref:histidine kinase n=1 Tax=Erythrobacter longus TaxID=1044 RepID=A0A074MFD7_ERYLO|nr:HAMP domain-containing sensor histidine kinase [Erythrobacter longus]KEO91510.1 histidine kinase [Erythrobacter longus]